MIGKRDGEFEKRMAVSLLIGVLSVLLIISAIPFSLSQESGGINYCCEKTTYGAWCQNEVREKCDGSYKVTPTACDSTSYCKRGCCYDSQEGICSKNTPQRICEDSGGAWSSEASCNIPQCELGCCLLADQAAFVTLTRCKAIAGLYGIESEFRKDVANEVECISLANAKDKGACVFEDPESHSPTCRFTTREQCTQGEFHKDVLCSADELETVCGPSRDTLLVEGRDEVYYKDTCGNPANIYDSRKYNDANYWTYVKTKAESCGYGESNAGSRTCGNCNYFLGSIGKRAGVLTGRAIYGDYICADLSCFGHKHGESWCVVDPGGGTGNGGDRVGSRYFKQICINGEVLTEPCADFRNEVCLQAETSGFSGAACIVNRWQNCVLQQEQSDCENIDIGDCMWAGGYYLAVSGEESGGAGILLVQREGETDPKRKTPKGICVPNYPPGYAFWGEQGSAVTSASRVTGGVITSLATADSEDENSEEREEARFEATEPEFNAGQPSFGTGAVAPRAGVSATDTCSMADSSITVLFDRIVKAFNEKEDWECRGEVLTKNTEVCRYFSDGKLINPAGLAAELNNICTKIGDCGAKANWIGKSTDDGYALYWKGDRVAGAGGAEVLREEGTTGSVIRGFLENVFGGEEESND